MADILFTKPIVLDKSKYLGEGEADCIKDLLHIHVWSDNIGINITAHGNTVQLGHWPHERVVPDRVRVKPGRFFDWRVKRAIKKMDRQVSALHAEHASIEATARRIERRQNGPTSS